MAGNKQSNMSKGHENSPNNTHIQENQSNSEQLTGEDCMVNQSNSEQLTGEDCMVNQSNSEQLTGEDCMVNQSNSEQLTGEDPMLNSFLPEVENSLPIDNSSESTNIKEYDESEYEKEPVSQDSSENSLISEQQTASEEVIQQDLGLESVSDEEIGENDHQDQIDQLVDALNSENESEDRNNNDIDSIETYISGNNSESSDELIDSDESEISLMYESTIEFYRTDRNRWFIATVILAVCISIINLFNPDLNYIISLIPMITYLFWTR